MGRLRYIGNARTGEGGTIVENTTQLQFNDDNAYIYGSTSGQLDLVADDVVVTGDLTVSGSLTYGSVGITLAQTVSGTLTVGTSNSGYDVIFYGTGSSNLWSWIAAQDGGGGVTMKGSFDINGDMELISSSGLTVGGTVAIAGNTTITAGTLTVGGTTPADVTFIGNADSHQWLWNENGGTSSHGSVVMRGDWTCVGEIDITGDVSINGDILMATDDQISFYGTSAYIQGTSDGVLALTATTIVLTGILTFTGAPTVSGTATFNGNVFCGLKLGVGGSGDVTALSAGTPTFEVYTTCSSTSTTTNAVPSYFNAVMTGTNGQGRAIEAVLSVYNTKLGSHCNAIKGMIDFNTSGMVTGLASGICAEMIMAGSTITGAGSYAVMELEMLCPASFAGPNPTNFIWMQVSGNTKANFDTYGNLFTVLGLTAASNKLQYNDTLRINVGGTIKYLPMSTTQGTYTSAYPVVLTNATAIAIESTIAVAYAYPFSVKATFETSGIDYYSAAARVRLTIAANTDITAGWATAIRARLQIEGDGSGTDLSSTGVFAAIEGGYYTDSAEINVSNGVHCAIAAQMLAGADYNLSGAADYCGLAVLDYTNGTADIAAEKYSGILIAGIHGGAGHQMGAAIKVGASVTNFLEIIDNDAIASLDANNGSFEHQPDGYIRISIGGATTYIWTHGTITGR